MSVSPQRISFRLEEISTRDGIHHKKFLDLRFNILEIGAYFLNIGVLKEIYQDQQFFCELLSQVKVSGKKKVIFL